MHFVEVGDDGSAQDAEPPSIPLTDSAATRRSQRNTFSSATCSALPALEKRNCPAAERLIKESRTQILDGGPLFGPRRASKSALNPLSGLLLRRWTNICRSDSGVAVAVADLNRPLRGHFTQTLFAPFGVRLPSNPQLAETS